MPKHKISPSYIYRAYNLVINSELSFPQLLLGEGEPDVIIRFGYVPDELEYYDARGVLYQANDHQFLLNLTNIARYLVKDGVEIIVSPYPEAIDSDVQVFLLGSCLGALLHQRGMLAIHASAIETGHGAILFCGPSGSGKSTLLGALIKRGYTMLADDVVGVVLNEYKQSVVLPGYPQIKLWEDSAEKLAQSTDNLHRVRPQLGKYAVPITDKFSLSQQIPLFAIYVLTPMNIPDIRLEPVLDSAKFDVILRNTYRERFLDGFNVRLHHFRLATAVAKTARISIAQRPTGSFRLEALVTLLEQDFTKAEET